MIQRHSTSPDSIWRDVRPVLLLLLLAVVAPTACLLWFMSEAVKNERLAVRQKLTVLFRARLETLQSALDEYWSRKANALGHRFGDETDSERFRRLIEAGIAEGAVLFNERGEIAYPSSPTPGPGNPKALAERDRIRRLCRVGQTTEAVLALRAMIDDEEQRNARDPHGRLIVPNLQILVAKANRVTDSSLAERLRDYGPPTLPSAQRQFLMHELSALADPLDFPTLEAEQRSTAWLDNQPPLSETPRLQPTGLDGLWHMISTDGSAVGLFTEETLRSQMKDLARSGPDLPNAGITVRLKTDPPSPSPFVTLPAGPKLPDWELTLSMDDAASFSSAANRQIATYLWTGLLAVLFIALLAALIARTLIRQIRLTRLKNDFVATVSHELKTPLASMRLLVDTLLEGQIKDAEKTEEYLRLIAGENERLSRLIENFLSFSRMERNRETFEMTRIDPGTLTDLAVAATRERFEAMDCSLDIEQPPDLVAIHADRDAMVTVLVNLLDNAVKYSNDDRRVRLRLFTDANRVCFEVQDHGIGLSRRDVKQVTTRFYQADRTLARKTGGCGLGLSIVQFIVDAHKGTLAIQSQPGRGSTFTVKIPIGGAA
ncbi:MAG: HAMP domain-containing sensor histidine kinase [Verrucomicrobiota bacterium]